MYDVYESADSADSDMSGSDRLRSIARFAKQHDCRARIVRDHVLVIGSDGAALATRSAARLAAWLGY